MSNAGQIHAGHRERMRDRFFEYGRDSFHTYELLEMLLYAVIPYKDTNPVSKNLLLKFKTADGVFCASRDELLSVDGVGEKVADFLLSVGKITAESIWYEGAHSDLIFNSYDKAGEYVCRRMQEEKDRAVLAFFLDNGLKLISAQTICEGLDFESGAVTPAPFLEAAIRVRAAAVILAHNHPYGPYIPTPGDRETQKSVEAGFRSIGVLPVEHYLICGNTYCGITRGGMPTRLAQTVTAEFGKGLMTPSDELVRAYDGFCRSREEVLGGDDNA